MLVKLLGEPNSLTALPFARRVCDRLFTRRRAELVCRTEERCAGERKITYTQANGTIA